MKFEREDEGEGQMKEVHSKATGHHKVILWMLDQSFGMLRYDDAVKKANANVVGIDLMPSARRALDQLTRKGWRSVLLTPFNRYCQLKPNCTNYNQLIGS